MKAYGIVRALVFAFAIALACVLLLVLFHDNAHVAVSSDAEILASFRGAAYEDIFGLGFWVTWFLIAFIEASLLLLAWFVQPTRPYRALVSVVFVSFLLVFALGYHAFSREEALWLMAN